jgi:hypothetical protein
MSYSPRIVHQLAVLIPTLGVSALLAVWRVPLLPRLVAGVGVGLILIVCVALWQRRRG